MTETVNIHEAKTHFSRLLEKVSRGEPVVIARAGKPIARMSRIEASSESAADRVGFLKGQLEIPDDLDRMGEAEIAALFQGDKSNAPAS
ncbi:MULTISPECIES: type II toxin-antitoxin system Phd/YefM family antitoxin [unclassified Thioalkalivibrio]|uniref:type II toxin-antitoxin system Phd/YefM family antitoxin n=1 Tax=unclassified Thioalkalivibrio TaxID=2621013 RepID=UPI0003818FCB|nr:MULTISPECIES: type II toxin-antitoxin system prevent-host-death family antitoxin [unclassified Thioalkalivibrio]